MEENSIKEETLKDKNKKKEKKVDLGKESVLKIFIYYAIPSILGMIAMTSAGIIDGVFVGNFVGADALAAINLSMPLLNVFSGIAVMVAMGGATLANIKRGEENIKESNNYFTITIYLILTIGVIATFFGFFYSEKFAILLGAQTDTYRLVSNYLRLISVFFIPFLATFTLDMFIRNDGFPSFPIICTVSGSVLNIILDYVFIAKFNMGLSGAAIATGLSQVIPAIIMTIFIIVKSSWKLIKPNFQIKIIGTMLFNGSSELLSNISVGISGYIFNLIIMKEIGTIGVAAYSIANYAAMIAIAIFFGIASAIGPGVSFNKGSGNSARVISFRRHGVIINLVFGVILSIALITFGEKIVTMFVGNDLKVQVLAIHIIRFYAVAMIFMGINVVSSMYYTAINEPMISATIASFRSLIALIIGVIVLPMIFGQNGIWASIVFAEIITLFITIYYFRKKPC